MGISWKNNNCVTVLCINIIVRFFDVDVILVKFSYLTKCHVNIVSGSGVMTIFVYQGLARNPEIGNNPLKVFLIAAYWGELGMPNLA